MLSAHCASTSAAAVLRAIVTPGRRWLKAQRRAPKAKSEVLALNCKPLPTFCAY